jgi:hypothetical protein
MFDIEYKGGNGVIIATKKTTVVIDPKLSVVGLKDLSAKDAVELATEARFATNNKDARLSIEGPGDYEIGDFSIRGVRAVRHLDTASDEPLSTMYRLEVGDVRLAVLGNIADQLDEEQLEALGVVDILVIPVGGGGYTLDATAAATLARHIDPKVVVPVHYADSAVKYEVPQDTLDTFVKELGSPVESTAKFKVKAGSALPPVLTIVELTRS